MNTRRTFLKTVGLSAAAILTRSVVGAPPKTAGPNIIYILADDMGYGDPSCYGQKTLKTPHIDALAAQGMRFTQHYSGSTVCAPSRCVLLTGLHTGHARIRNNARALLKDSDATIPKVLRKVGYRTGLAGKWGVGHPPPPGDPNRCGFDYFYGYVSMYHAHNFFPTFMIENGRKVALRNVLQPRWRRRKDGAGVAARKIDYAPDLIHKKALAFIERNAGKPFFLYYALNMPHANNEGGSSPDGMEVPDYGEFDKRDWPANEKGFASMMRRIDNYVAEVIAKLKALGLDEKTLVIFSSDNGPHAEGGHKMEYFDSNGPLRGMKRDVYEGGLRVPMIARWPGRIKAGTVSPHISGFQDIMATFAELAGAKCPPTDGISIVATLMGRPAEQDQKRHEHLYWEFPRGRSARFAVLKGRFKAVRYKTRGKLSPVELYDINKEITERTNVADKHPEIVAEMSKIMVAEHAPSQ